MISAIPRSWTNSNLSREFNLTLYDYVRDSGKISNKIYSILIDDKNKMIRRKNRWERLLTIQIDLPEFLKAFDNIYKHTICTKFRDFQYRLLCGIIPTNRKLYLWKISDTQMCSFCQLETEDELHLFVDCNKVQVLWIQLKNWIKNNECYDISSKLEWSPLNIMFSCVDTKPNSAINFLVTITKQFIFRTKCAKSLLSFSLLENEFDKVYDIERIISLRKNTWNKHVHKWNSIKEIAAREFTYIDQYLQSD